MGIDIELQETSYTIMYDEDKEDKLFLHKDSRRFVRDTQTGDVYYTADHYETFIKIIE